MHGDFSMQGGGAKTAAWRTIRCQTLVIAVEILPVTGKEAAAIAEIMKKYGNLRPRFADVMLVYMADRENIKTIFTLDRRDFSIYRAGRKGSFPVVPE